MQWTPELVKAEMDYRLQDARHGITVRALREARRTSPRFFPAPTALRAAGAQGPPPTGRRLLHHR